MSSRTFGFVFFGIMATIVSFARIQTTEAAAGEHAISSSQDRFAAANQAIGDGDWESAVKILESLVGDGVVTPSVLKNLAIARSKQHDLPQSLAAWLAARSLDPHDPVILEGVLSTLTSLQLGPDAVDLSAHGPVTTWLSERNHQDVLVFIYGAMACLLFTILCVASAIFCRDRFLKIKHTARVMIIPAMTVTAIAWTAALWAYTHSGIWGTVIDAQGAPLRASAVETATELTRLKPGMPVFVTGDTYQKWLDVRTADGHHGYVDALTVRVIRTMF